MNNEDVKKYYDYTLPFYRFFYHKKSNAIHYGFWDNNVKNHQEALINVNRFLAKTARIKSSEIILDAGCGIGGSAIWLAKHYKVHVIGITVSKKQLDEAKRLSRENKVNHSVNFYQRDFLNSGFKDKSFDVIWAIESVCYAENKKDFLKEAYRLLKDNGRLVVDDGFLLRRPRNKREGRELSAFLDGFVLPNLAGENEFRQFLQEVGFKNIKVYDKSKETLPSSKKIYRMSIFSYPVSWITEKLRLTPKLLTKNNLTGIIQYKLIQSGLMGFRVFYAEK